MLYIVSIFDAAGSSVDSYVASIIFGVMQTIGGLLAIILIERTGRRPLLFASTLGVTTCHIVLGILFLVQSLNYDTTSIGWLPIVTIGIFAVSCSAGLGPLLLTVANEVFHPDAASFCQSVTLFVFNLAAFLTVKLFPVIGDSIGLYYCFFIMGGYCICTFLLILFFVPETKGRTKESILNELRLGRKVRGILGENYGPTV
uniref:Major facilitator superfamily (MFS) profile domain-containing protein n=1 Tax=Bracon brevicornis TaxID=1563983 RepID=A0A6V7J229_9HYME